MRQTVMKQKTQDFIFDKRVRDQGFDMKNSHYHGHYELYYLISGQCRIFINHTLYDVEPGTVILIRPMEIHRSTYQAAPGNERIAINFSKDYLAVMENFCGREEVEELLGQHKFIVPAVRRSFVEGLMEKLEYESAQKDVYSKFLLKNHLYELLIIMNRCQETGLPKKIDGVEKTIQEAAQYIFHHYDHPLDLEMLSAKVHMSPSYFSRKFKKVTGFGFKEYLNHVRISNACKELLDGHRSVTEIATKCGFSDGNYFGDVFRKEKGMSPNQYRKNPEVF